MPDEKDYTPRPSAEEPNHELNQSQPVTDSTHNTQTERLEKGYTGRGQLPQGSVRTSPPDKEEGK